MSNFLTRLFVVMMVVGPLWAWLQPPWYAVFSIGMSASLLFDAATKRK